VVLADDPVVLADDPAVLATTRLAWRRPGGAGDDPAVLATARLFERRSLTRHNSVCNARPKT